MSRVSNVAVHVRVRGFDEPDPQRPLVNYTVDGTNKSITWTTPRTKLGGADETERLFQYDHVFDMGADQSTISDRLVHPMIEHAWEGFNSCLFAYGQTGSGKTYSIFGEAKGPRRGIAPRVMDEMFSVIEKQGGGGENVGLLVSFLEIYLERVRDLGIHYLLNKQGNSSKLEHHDENLKIRQDENGTVYVKNLQRIHVSSVEEGLDVIRAGLQKRQTYETEHNPVSSRSHTVLTLTLVRADQETGDMLSGSINLVDLAGSERLTADQNTQPDRLRETKAINSSLSSLGKVVMSLNSGDIRHIPYRDSKLTRILQNSLGGNSFCTLLATVNPIAGSYEESLNTLQFANRCKNVLNTIHINVIEEDPISMQKKIKRLQAEVSELQQKLQRAQMSNMGLRRRLKDAGGDPGEDDLDEIVNMSDVGDGKSGGQAGTEDGVAGKMMKSISTSGSFNNELMKDMSMMSVADQKSFESKMSQKKGVLLQKIKGEKAAIEKKLRDAAAEKEALEKRISEMEKTHLATATKFRNQIQQLNTDIKEVLSSKEALRKELEQQREVEVNNLMQKSNELMSNYQAEFSKIRKVYGFSEGAANESVSPAQLGAKQKLEAEQRNRIDAAVAKERIRAAKDMEKRMKSMKEQFEAYSMNKNADMQRFVSEYKDYREAKKKQLAQLETEVKYLYDFVHLTTSIIHNMESGQYDITDQCGIKTYSIPKKLRSQMALAPERCKEISKYIRKARNFLKKQGLSATNPERLFTGDKKRPTSKGADRVDGEATIRIEAAKQQMLDDLASNKTVQYIKRIEEERDYYKKQAHDQTSMSSTMKSSLEAARRQIGRLEDRLARGVKSPSNGTKPRWEYSMQSERYSSLGSPMTIAQSEYYVRRKGHVDAGYSSPVANSPSMKASSTYGLKRNTSYGPKQHKRAMKTTYSRNTSIMLKTGAEAMGESSPYSNNSKIKFFNFER